MDNEMPIAEIMMIQMCGNRTDMDQADVIRTHMFCMDIENVSKELFPEELPKDLFIDKFVKEIQKSTGYRTFSSFCIIEIDALKDLGDKAYELLK